MNSLFFTHRILSLQIPLMPSAVLHSQVTAHGGYAYFNVMVPSSPFTDQLCTPLNPVHHLTYNTSMYPYTVVPPPLESQTLFEQQTQTSPQGTPSNSPQKSASSDINVVDTPAEGTVYNQQRDLMLSLIHI